MAKKEEPKSVPAQDKKNSSATRLVETQVVDGKLVADTLPGVLQ